MEFRVARTLLLRDREQPLAKIWEKQCFALVRRRDGMPFSSQLLVRAKQENSVGGRNGGGSEPARPAAALLAQGGGGHITLVERQIPAVPSGILNQVGGG